MPYPQTYDALEGIDLGECSLFTHILTDGIVDEFSNIILDNQLTFFVKYGSGVPKVSIINPLSDNYLMQDITGVYSNITTLYRFTIAIPSAGTLTDDLNDLWKEMVAIVKVESDESDIVFTRSVQLINPINKCATKDDVEQVINKLDELLVNETKQSKNIEYLSNGWKLVF